MEIIIDSKNRINVTDDYFALMVPSGDKRKNMKEWKEVRWFTKLDNAIASLVQKRLGEDRRAVDMAEFIKIYMIIHSDIKRLIRPHV